MIEIQIGLDGVPSQRNVVLGNKYENKDESIHFALPAQFDSYNKYVIGVIKNTKDMKTPQKTVVLPVNNDILIVSTSLTYNPGKWDLYLMCRERALNLDENPVDVSPKQNERVFISDRIIGNVVDSSIFEENLENIPLDENLQIIYDDLLALISQVKSDLENGAYDGFSPTIAITDIVGGHHIVITDKDGVKEFDVFDGEDYEHSEEFEALSNQVRDDASKSQKALEDVNTVKTEVESIQSGVLESKTYIDQVYEDADVLHTSIQTIETSVNEKAEQAKTSAEAALASQNAAKSSEQNAKTSEQNAKTSEQNARTSETEAKSSSDTALETLSNIQSIKTEIDKSAQEASANASSAALSAQTAQEAMTQANQTAEQNIADLNNIKTSALEEFETSKSVATKAVQDAQTNAESAIEETKQSAVGAVQTAQTEGIEVINKASTDAQNVITTAKVNAVKAVQSAQQTAENAIGTKQTEAVQAVDTAKTSATQAIAEQKESAVSAITQERSEAIEAIETGKTNAIETITTAKNDAIEEIENTGVPLEDIEKLAIKETATGNPTIINNSADWRLQKLNIYGQSSQDGTPTPESPVEIISKEVSEIKVTNGADLSQTITLTEPITLRGIPVSSGGNVTIDGQQYVSDVITEKYGIIGVESNCYPKELKIADMNNSEDYPGWNNIDDIYIFAENGKTGALNTRLLNITTNLNTVFYNTVKTDIYMNKILYLSKSLFNGKTQTEIKESYPNSTVVFVFERLEPTFEPLPEEVQAQYKALKSYYPNTVIQTGCWNEVEYVADTKMYIDKKLAQINELKADVLLLGGNK